MTISCLSPGLAAEDSISRVEQTVLDYYNKKHPQAPATSVRLRKKPGKNQELPTYTGLIYLRNGKAEKTEATKMLNTGTYLITTFKKIKWRN
jgi:hypothetical protein